MFDRSPSVCVGIQFEHVEGLASIEWLNLDDYSDSDEFNQACLNLYEKLDEKDEDPEFLFQSWDGIPDRYISEEHIDEEYWDYQNFVMISNLSSDVFEAGADLDIDYYNVEERYVGKFPSDLMFAMNHAESTGALDNLAEWPHSCIDWDHAATELMQRGFIDSNDYYFTEC